jgi:hypothetical protein
MNVTAKIISDFVWFIRNYPGFGAIFGAIAGALINVTVVWVVANVFTKRMKRVDSTLEFNRRYQDLIRQSRDLENKFRTASDNADREPLKDDAFIWWLCFFDLMLFQFDFFCEGLILQRRFTEWMRWRRVDFAENWLVGGVSYQDGWKKWANIPAMRDSPFIGFFEQIHNEKAGEVEQVVSRFTRHSWRRLRTQRREQGATKSAN